MMCFHRHHWHEIRRIFTSPLREKWSLDRGGSETVEAFAFGFTTIEFRCIHCNEMKMQRVIGDVRVPINTGGISGG